MKKVSAMAGLRRKFGYPDDNMSNIKADNEIILTGDEVRERFPNQFVVLKVLEYKDIDDLLNFSRAIVKYFKCEEHFSAQMAKHFRKEYPEDIYISKTYYDVGLEDYLLRF